MLRWPSPESHWRLSSSASWMIASGSRGAIERRLRLRRSAALDDVILVPCGDGYGDVIALRGAAGIAFAHLARKLPEVAWPGWPPIEAAMATLLPTWAIPTERLAEGQLIDRLCQTVSVAARYELSPGARMARGSTGCTSAAIDLQIAWLDGDPPGGSTYKAPPAGLMPSGEREKSLPSRGASRTQYLALCRVFPTVDRDTHLPATARTIPSGEAASARSREAVIDEIRAMRSAAAADRRATDRGPLGGLGPGHARQWHGAQAARRTVIDRNVSHPGVGPTARRVVRKWLARCGRRVRA